MNLKIVYQSQTGFTQKYANWIKEELEAEILTYKEFLNKGYNQNEIIIYGSSLMANQIKGIKKVKEMVPQDKLIVFVTGAMPNNAIEIIDTIKNTNFTKEEQNHIPSYYFQGGLNFQKLGIVQRNLLKIMKKMLNRKKEKTKEEEGMIEALEKSFDATNKDNIKELVEYVKNNYKV